LGRFTFIRLPVLFYLLYQSRADRTFALEDLPRLLGQSTRHNSRAGLTGLLVYRDGRFMQYLEGPREAVADLMTRIKADARHHDVETLAQGPIATRAFGGWSMGFVDVEAARDTPDYRSFVHTALARASMGAERADVAAHLTRFGVEVDVRAD
jgi:hypothetical protein